MFTIYTTEKCAAGLYSPWSLSRQCNGAEVDEVQKFLTFNFIIFRVDSLRAGGWWCSLEPVQLLQLSAKCGEW